MSNPNETREVGVFWPSPALRFPPPLKAEVVFYGLTFGRWGIGFIRQTKRNDGSEVGS